MVACSPHPHGQGRADGLWLREQERPTLVTPTGPSPALPQRKGRQPAACWGREKLCGRCPERRVQSEDSRTTWEGGLAVSSLKWKAAHSCGNSPTPPPTRVQELGEREGPQKAPPRPWAGSLPQPSDQCQGKGGCGVGVGGFELPGWRFNWEDKGTLHSLCR